MECDNFLDGEMIKCLNLFANIYAYWRPFIWFWAAMSLVQKSMFLYDIQGLGRAGLPCLELIFQGFSRPFHTWSVLLKQFGGGRLVRFLSQMSGCCSCS